MQIRQFASIDMAIEKALHGVIKGLAEDPKLKGISSESLSSTIATRIIQKASIGDIRASIDLYRKEEGN